MNFVNFLEAHRFSSMIFGTAILAALSWVYVFVLPAKKTLKEKLDDLEQMVKEGLLREKEKDVDMQIEDIKVINVVVAGKDIQAECQKVVTKMFSNGYRLTMVVPVTDYSYDYDRDNKTKTVSLVHYFEKKSVAENSASASI